MSYKILCALILAVLMCSWSFNKTFADDQMMTPSVSTELVVHEWGTFTALSDGQGVMLDWQPLSGPSDLPSFVYVAQNLADNIEERTGIRCHYSGKGCQRGSVRMETPVIYFYGATTPTEVTVKVDFPGGMITEWYPKARFVNQETIDWGRFIVAPSEPGPLLTESAPSHYYPARETDAQQVRFCDSPHGGNSDLSFQFEQFLFYRGLGSPKLPVTVSLSDNHINFSYEGLGSSPKFIVFDRAGDAIGISLVEPNKSKTQTTTRPERTKTLHDVLATLKTQLIANGLFEKEADAMIKTWRDTWFEDGLRIFVILPREQTDAMLPLTINPTPKHMERVIVARIEVLTPEQELAVTKAVQNLKTASASDLPALRDTFFAKHGHFGEALILRLLDKSPDSEERTILNSLLAK